MRELDSILNSIKKKVGIDADYKVFDDPIIDSINSAFFTLWQLGVGRDPTNPFRIQDDTAKWSDFIDDGMIEACRDYIGNKVKLVFDPPTNSFLVENLKAQNTELEYRMTVAMDEYNARSNT